MRKIAAHFILRPDGSVGKFPIIEFDEYGKIIQIREREQFKEEPSLELVNGFLCPGFIDCIPNSIVDLDDIEIKKYLNRQVISGVKVLGGSTSVYSKVLNLLPGEIELVKTGTACCSKENSFIALFQLLKQKNAGIELLSKYTCENASLFNIEKKYGSLDVGKTPGIIAISGMDYSNMTITGTSKIKLIK